MKVGMLIVAVLYIIVSIIFVTIVPAPEPETMDFAIRVFGSVSIGGVEFLITETLLSTWIVMAILVSLAVLVRVKSKKWVSTGKPTGLQNAVEFAVDAFSGLVKGNAGEKMAHLTPWLFTLFVFLILSNMIGVVGIRPPTADWGMTFPLAFASFMMFQYAGLRYRPKGYLKGILLEPIFLFAPINIMGEIAKPVALSFRLFGNILGGMVLMSLLYGLAPVVLRFVLPIALHMYFDLAAGALQAFIFTVLSLTFLGLAAED